MTDFYLSPMASYLEEPNATTQSALVARVAKNVQNLDVHAEPAAATAENFSNSGQANGKGVAQDESVILHNNILTN